MTLFALRDSVIMRTLEDAIISETQLLVTNIAKLNNAVSTVNDIHVIQLIDQLRRTEKRMSFVYTFFKTATYASHQWNDTTNRPAFEDS
ncbi:hypothetical protein BDF14DRAFT_1998520 [Spinellus fusiger]|nr:hypothetical protein BDF14DRAFT_1998520 [Spinellus fusiger]